MGNNAAVHAYKYLRSDEDFDRLYPRDIQLIGKRHWTPIQIARLVIGFLAGKNARILDIGSGVGKFCLTAGYYEPDVTLVGVEQRQNLIEHAVRAQETLGLRNVSFINKNFTQVNLQDYTHFYFYNSFFENLDSFGRIDETIDYSEALYEYYVRYLYRGLQEMPDGTRIATYHTLDDEIPRGYRLVETHAKGELKFWVKETSEMAPPKYLP